METIPVYSTTLRNRLSSFVSPEIKHLLVARMFLGPTTGRLIRAINPSRNVAGLKFDYRSKNLALGELPNLFFNRRERAELDFVKRHIIADPDIKTVVELGTSIGFVAANIVSKKHIHYFGVEGSPRLTTEARVNIAANNRTSSTWRVENYCIDYSGPEFIEFGECSDSLVGRAGAGESTVQVRAITLGAIVDVEQITDYALIADIEGAEAEMLYQDGKALRACRLFIAELEDTPLATIQEQVMRAEALGLKLKERFRNVFAFRRQ